MSEDICLNRCKVVWTSLNICSAEIFSSGVKRSMLLHGIMRILSMIQIKCVCFLLWIHTRQSAWFSENLYIILLHLYSWRASLLNWAIIASYSFVIGHRRSNPKQYVVNICQCILVNMMNPLIESGLSCGNRSVCQIQHCPRSPQDRRLIFGRPKQGVRELCLGFLSTRPRHKYEEMINQQTNKHGRYGRVLSKFNLNQRPLVNPWLITFLTPEGWEVQVRHGTCAWHDDMNCTVLYHVRDNRTFSRFLWRSRHYVFLPPAGEWWDVQHRWSQESFAFMKLVAFGQALNITNGISSSFFAANCTCPWICCSRLTRILPNLCILFLRGLFANQYC